MPFGMPIGSGIHITAESFMEMGPNPTKYFTSLLPVKLCIVYQYYSEQIIVISHSGKPTPEMFSGLTQRIHVVALLAVPPMKCGVA